MKSSKLAGVILALVVALLVSPSALYGVAIPLSDAASTSVPSVAGDGITVEIFLGVGGGQAPAPAHIQGRTPSAALLSPAIDFPHPGSTVSITSSFQSFFADTVVAPDSVKSLMPQNFILRCTSLLKVTKALDRNTSTAPIDIRIGQGSDDGHYLVIGNQYLGNSGDHGFTYYWYNLEFEGEGLYPIYELFAANSAGVSGLELSWDVASGQSIIPQSHLYTTEPGCSNSITFEEYAAGTEITDQFRPLGVVFNRTGGNLQITNAQPTRFVPVSGDRVYGDPASPATEPGAAELQFVVPGTSQVGAVDYFSCYVINATSADPAIITAYDPRGRQVFTGSYSPGGAARELVEITQPLMSRIVVTLGSGSNTSALDNLCFGTPSGDDTPPETSITAGPVDGVAVCTADISFTLTGSDNTTPVDKLEYTWRLDGGDWQAPSAGTTVALTALADGSHVFEAAAIDQFGNQDATPEVRHFTVDAVPVAVSNVASKPADVECLLTFTTDSPVTTRILYGTTTSYGSTTELETTPTTSHSFILTGLTPNTQYYYCVSFSNACGDELTSTDGAFKTLVGPPVSWVNWTSGTAGANGHATGVLEFGGTTVDVDYSGEIAFIQTSGGTNYWNPSGSYISEWCGNAPPASDIIALSSASAKTLTFSEAISGLLFAVVSLNGNGYRFDRDFDILSYGCGYWGCGTLTKQDMGDGTFRLNGSGEPHGVIRFKGAATSITWTSLTNEYWNGFTVGTYGVILDTAPPDTQITSADPAEGAALCAGMTTFEFTGLDDVTPTGQLSYQWRLDDGPWSTPSTNTSVLLDALYDGPHTFEVAAVDWKDKIDPTPAVRHFFVDTVRPTISDIVVTPSTSTCVISWNTDQPATTQVLFGAALPYDRATTLDATMTITHTAIITGLIPGSTYHYAIVSDDACPQPPTPDDTFTTLVDILPPETQIDSGPAQGAAVCSLPVTFGWSATDNTPDGITYSYRMDGGQWSSWAAETSFSYDALSDGPHTFEVKSKDLVGNEDVSPAKRDFLMHSAAPTITEITANAGRTSAIVTWTTDVPGTSQVFYGLTDALGQATPPSAVMVTSHRVTLSNLSPGTTYHYKVVSSDNCAHEAMSEGRTFVTAPDTTPPDTQITSGPSEGSSVCDAAASFTYTGSDDSSPASALTYAYRIDNGEWSAYNAASTITITGLVGGNHTFEVKARDASGNEDATPAVRSFSVKLDPPAISDVAADVAQMQCTITWTTDQPSSSQVEYGATTAYGTLSPLSSTMVTSHSITLSGLSPSKTYHYRVHSKDSCNRDGVSADLSFTTPADSGEPNTWFTSGPSEGGRVCSTSQEFCWTGSDTVTPTPQLAYAYKLDNGSWSTPTADTCRTFSALAEGGHTLYVRAVDTSGNADSTPAARSFTVDLSTGTLYNINSAAGSTEATVVWSSSKPMDSQVEYGLTTAYGSTTSVNVSLATNHSVVVSGLTPDTLYHYRVRSKDGCGREVISPDKTFSTTADQNAPQTTITSGPPDSGKACATTVDLCWTGSDNATPSDQLLYSYKMDSDPWSAWTAEVCHRFTELAEGLHTFMVKAKDAVGNEDLSPAVKYFYVDLTAPAISANSITSSPKQSTCIINWRTGEPATAQVEYGRTVAYGSVSAVDTNMLTTHKITLSGLTPETTYHYRVKSSDGCQYVVSDDQTFTTTAVQPPNLKPIQLTVPITTSSNSNIKISWVIQNLGPGDAEGAWTDKLYLSQDETVDAGDTVIWEGAGSSPMPVPYTYSKQIQLQMPMKPVGAYYMILVCDAGSALTETNEADNSFAQPIVFIAQKPLIAAPENINVRLDPLVSAYGQFDLSNIGDGKLTGITAEVNGAAANITLSTSNVAPEMDPLTNRRISYQITAADESVLSSAPTVTFTTNEGASATVVFNLVVRPRLPKLAVNPGYLSGPMVRGQQTFYECEVTNQGGVPANDLRVLLPNASWLSLVTPADLGTIGPGEKKTVGLSLKPPSDMALGDYTSSFVVVGTNANISVSFRFTCISIETGSIKIWAEDEFTTFADDHPYVSGATVTLKDHTTGEVKYSGVTGEDGIWFKELITESNYYLEVAAPKHGTYRSPVQIVAGQTKEIHAFLPRQLVTYTWTVEPVQIEDKYRVVLEATFETHVPAPVVTIEPRTVVVPVIEGQTATQYVTVTNHGLIAAHEVEVSIGDTDNWYVTPGIRKIGELPAMTSVVVPVYIRSKADGPITNIPQVATSTLTAEAVAAKAATMAQRESVVADNGGGGGSGGQPSLCDILNGKVVHVVYCSGGQWQTADFSMSPIKILLNIIDALGCVAGNIQSCLSLACDLAQIDPCICFFIDPLSAGGAYNAAQCLACHGFPGGSGSPSGGGGDWGWGWSPGSIGPGGISGPSGIEESVPCDPATRPQSLTSALGGVQPAARVPDVLVTSPPDIAKYGGRLVRYRVNVLPEDK